MSRHPMSAVDAAWLRMDRPTNLMVVTTVMWFDGPLDGAALRHLIDERLIARFPRFRQRVVEDDGLFWEDVEEFCLEDRLHDVRLPEPAGRSELEDFASSLVSIPLDRDHPLWELHLVRAYLGGSAAVFRMHHAIADGVALAQVLLSLTDDSAAGSVAVAPAAQDAGQASGSVRRAVTDALAHAVTDLIRQPLALAGRVSADAVALAELALLPPDHRTALRGRAGTAKRVLWSDPVPLSVLRDAGHLRGVTVNDLLLTAVAGALRSHLVRLRSPVHDVRAIVPVNIRPADGPLPAELGNAFGLVYLPLPLTVAARSERLEAMARRTRQVKHSAQGVVSYLILQAIGRSPMAMENVAIDVFAAKGTGVITNVPGPRSTVTLAGTPLAGSIGWGPTSGELGLGVALFSYAGTVVVGLCVDAALVPDPDLLLRDILAELDELVGEGTVGPEGDGRSARPGREAGPRETR